MTAKRFRTPLESFAFLVLFLCLPRPSFPWGWDQHKVVAEIAEENLTPPAKQGVAALLGPQAKLSDVAIWADEIKDERPDTAPCHYINYPLELLEPKYDVRQTEDGNIVSAIEAQIAILKDREASLSARREALKFLVHFVGDIHQPLHCGCAADRGGNKVALLWKGKVMNLHSFWDVAVLPKEERDILIWAARFQKELTPASRLALMQGGPYDWMVESRRILKDFCYPRLRRFYPFPSQRKILTYDEGDLPAAQKLAREQLLKAGLRLAAALNNIFASPPSLSPAPSSASPSPRPSS
ncbi:MAG: S1/P1 nuclease [Candidatus Aureabacteria bacterium]|nr:S1/P1 nuclease [Candidatus Auribacterota bacterium]